MRVKDIKSVKSEAIEIGDEKAWITFWVAPKETVTVEYGDVTLFTLAPGDLYRRTFVIEGDEEGATVEFKSKKDFGLAVKVARLPKKEAQDFNAPPPPPEANNLLQQIRNKVRSEMGVMRESFLLQNDTGHPGYELSDEEPYLFEEEIAEIKKSEQSERENSEARRAEEKISSEQSGNSEEINSAEKTE